MIVVDAGHGGDDPGAIGNDIIEKDLNLSISQYMANRFKELNIPVEMTRTTDETLSPTERVNRVLNAFGANPNVIVISNHINSSGGDGAEVIYPLRNNSVLADLILSQIGKSGQNIRRAYQRRLPSDSSKDYYFMQRETTPTQALTVEYGFLDSPADDVFQLKNFSNDYAEAVVQAVTQYLSLPYTPPEGTNIYIVQSGDNIYTIARRYNTTTNEIMKANDLPTNNLSIGQRLRIPVSETPTTYVVQSGDNIYAIAREFNTTVDNIKSKNNLSTNNLSVGQILII